MSYAAYNSATSGAGLPGQRLRVNYESVVSLVVFLWLSCSSITFIEPSPYDFFALLAVPLWFFGGVKVHRGAVLILLLWTIYNVLGLASMLPYWNEPDPRLYQLQSFYLFVTVVVFTLYFSERATTRLDVGMKGYTMAGLLAGGVGIAGYLNIAGLGEYATMYEGRVSGTFKDPNVLGSFLLAPITYLYSLLLLNRTKWNFITGASLAALLGALFLSFSRGAWGACIVSLGIVTVFGFLTSQSSAVRKRIVTIVALGFAAVILGAIAVLSHDATRELLLLRASPTQDYDVGDTGRFGNQLRAIQQMLNLPFGYGPLRFRLTFALDPHNSYIGAFANYGWVGGILWLYICVITVFVGFRLIWRNTPFRPLAMGIFPATFALLLQGLQIDVDHWRHLYICFGMVWGLEIARQRWEMNNALAFQNFPSSVSARG